MLDIRQDPRYAKYMQSRNWSVERRLKINYLIKKVPIIGTFLKVQRPEKLDFGQIERLQKKYRVFQTIVEPKNEKQARELESRGYRMSRSPYLPTTTLQINLRQTKKKIFEGFDKDTRYCLRKTQDIHIFTDPSLEDFHKSWQKAVGWARFVPSLKSLQDLNRYYGGNIIFASHNDDGTKNGSMLNSGAIFIKSDKTTYYWQAFTNKSGRSTLSQYALVWYGILWGKSSGARVFDFEGIYDNRFPNKSWRGFTHFKKGFGGKVITYPGTYTKSKLRFV